MKDLFDNPKLWDWLASGASLLGGTLVAKFAPAEFRELALVLVAGVVGLIARRGSKKAAAGGKS